MPHLHHLQNLGTSNRKRYHLHHHFLLKASCFPMVVIGPWGYQQLFIILSLNGLLLIFNPFLIIISFFFRVVNRWRFDFLRHTGFRCQSHINRHSLGIVARHFHQSARRTCIRGSKKCTLKAKCSKENVNSMSTGFHLNRWLIRKCPFRRPTMFWITTINIINRINFSSSCIL